MFDKTIGFFLCLSITFTICNGDTRIVNGVTATAGQFPYVVSLQEVRSDFANAQHRGHVCGGALITYSHVVTTATCVHNVTSNGFYTLRNPSDYRVLGGSTALTNDSSTNNYRVVYSFIPHPNFTAPPSYVNDIAIVNLTSAFPTNIGIVPIHITTSVPADYTECTVTGWGAVSSTTTTLASTNLLYAPTLIHNQAICTTYLNALVSSANVLPTMVCATFVNVQITSCTNDTGNPLVCNNELTGVLSWPLRCGSVTSFPEVYTRTANYTAWINSVINSDASTSFISSITLIIPFVIVSLFTSCV